MQSQGQASAVDKQQRRLIMIPQQDDDTGICKVCKDLNGNYNQVTSQTSAPVGYLDLAGNCKGAGRWHLRVLESSTPECRDGALVMHDGAMYLLGGYCTSEPFSCNGSSNPMFASSSKIFRLVTSAVISPVWKPLPRLTFRNRQDLPRPGIIACGHGAGIYIYGGYREDGFTGEMSFIDLARGSCQGLDVGSDSSPMEDGIGSRMASVLHDGQWIVARRLIMTATLYKFSFQTKSWSAEELHVEGREDDLMCIQELAVHGGLLYALNEDVSEGHSSTALEIRCLQGHVWRKVEPIATPHWIQAASVMETFYRGAVVGDNWVIWGCRSPQEFAAQHGSDLSNPPTVLTVDNAEAYYSSDWAAAFKIFPIVYNFSARSWTSFDPDDNEKINSSSIQGYRPITRKNHTISAGPDGRSVYICGGEMLPVPGNSGVPIPCHVTEQLSFLTPLKSNASRARCGQTFMPSSSDLLEEVYSSAHQILDDSLCDVDVYPCSSPELVVRFSSLAMCQRSEVFQLMFTSSMAESSSRKVELPVGVSKMAIQALRHVCHLELDALQTCTDKALTLVELYSLCHTYLVQPLGIKLAHGLIEAKLQDPDRGVGEAVSFWDAMYTTPLRVVFHQGLPEIIAGYLVATRRQPPGSSSSTPRIDSSFLAALANLSEEKHTALLAVMEQIAMEQHVQNIVISDQ